MIIHVKYLICVDNNQLLSSTKEYLYHPLLIPPVRYLITCQTHTSKVVVWIGVEVEEKSWRDLSSSSKSDNQCYSDFRSLATISTHSSAMNNFNMFIDETNNILLQNISDKEIMDKSNGTEIIF